MKNTCKYVRIKEGVNWNDLVIHTECGHMLSDGEYFYTMTVENCPYCGGTIEHVKEA